MLGAIIGDIVGSRFEFDFQNHKSKAFEFFHDDCEWTDDSLMTLAVADALLRWRQEGGDLRSLATEAMQRLAAAYPYGGYGGMFVRWLATPNPEPYHSFGNGSAMRVSPCGWVASSLEKAKALSRQVTDISHDHPEGIKGAEATAVAVWLARQGWTMEAIRGHIVGNYYPIGFTLDEIRPTYHMDETCQGSVPQALEAFFESTSFEDAVRNAVSIGGDSDTIAAITGAVAEAFWGIPADFETRAKTYLEPGMNQILEAFSARFGSGVKR